ncbi:MAG TPA: hypothetical protein DDX92_06215 [Flavobacteriales bacterium]|jgi:hypothetical protein|nr:hypothetical protein [Flavobacteriales bacterium]
MLLSVLSILAKKVPIPNYAFAQNGSYNVLVVSDFVPTKEYSSYKIQDGICVMSNGIEQSLDEINDLNDKLAYQVLKKVSEELLTLGFNIKRTSYMHKDQIYAPDRAEVFYSDLQATQSPYLITVRVSVQELKLNPTYKLIKKTKKNESIEAKDIWAINLMISRVEPPSDHNPIQKVYRAAGTNLEKLVNQIEKNIDEQKDGYFLTNDSQIDPERIKRATDQYLILSDLYTVEKVEEGAPDIMPDSILVVHQYQTGDNGDKMTEYGNQMEEAIDKEVEKGWPGNFDVVSMLKYPVLIEKVSYRYVLFPVLSYEEKSDYRMRWDHQRQSYDLDTRGTSTRTALEFMFIMKDTQTGVTYIIPYAAWESVAMSVRTYLKKLEKHYN